MQIVAQTSSAQKAKTSANGAAEESAANLDVLAASSKPSLRDIEGVRFPLASWRKNVGRDYNRSYVFFVVVVVQKIEG